MAINWEELNLMLEDENAVFAVIHHHLNVVAAIIDTEWREYPPWVKVGVNVADWQTMQGLAFQRHFRMSREVFNALKEAVELHLRENGKMRREQTDFDLCLMMSLWIIMNMDTFKNTALLFGVSPGVVLYHYKYIIECLREMGPTYIKWPSPEERQIIKENFLQIGGYPGAVGCIDGMHTYVTAPLNEAPAYVNRHHSHSILSQAVVDDQLLVRDLYVGEPGSIHDSRMFRRSSLSSNLLENPGLLAPDEHLLGDGAYILTDKVMVPYDNHAVLNAAQRLHNTTLSSIRSHVENAFCYVKMRFPRLKYFRSLVTEYAVDHIVSCFVLHNFVTLHGEAAPDFDIPEAPAAILEIQRPDDRVEDEDLDMGAGDFPNVPAELDHPLLLEARLRGEEKREAIAQWITDNRRD
ncbi:Putative nuclease [Frankliniella fusca]|uniref:Nuclease n=1 Tax=Frankliniella fusca TaxID=407009 RepID=A0AAE1LPL1_9NEOP|nr:Putative nuclease [Frankliniella fusca]KAK3925642.1 Putative nuclease [Frankliniella fusca]